MIGGTAGASALGQVHLAFRLVDALRDLAFTAQWRLMLPLLSERQHDMPGLHDVMDRCLAWSSLLAFPLCAAMAVALGPLVLMLLGPVWRPSGEAALPLIALTAWLFLAFPAGVAVVARGEARYTLIANLAATVATIVGVLLLRPSSPLHAVLVWLGAQLCVFPYVPSNQRQSAAYASPASVAVGGADACSHAAGDRGRFPGATGDRRTRDARAADGAATRHRRDRNSDGLGACPRPSWTEAAGRWQTRPVRIRHLRPQHANL